MVDQALGRVGAC